MYTEEGLGDECQSLRYLSIKNSCPTFEIVLY